jgi:diaminopimelate epimerase
MKFTKLHGAGNDFIVVDARGVERDWPRLAAAICDRHLGAGADGLLLVEDSPKAALRMRLYNADGSEAEMSGNGLRCFVKYAVDRGIARLAEGGLAVETPAGVLSARVTLADGGVASVRVSMGRPRFAPQEVPVAVEGDPPLLDVPLEVDGERFSLACVSMGNPHAVQFTEAAIDGYPLERFGPRIERHPMFPARVNFSIARVEDGAHIASRTWERGVGETLSCGTGASAVVVAARVRGLAGDRVEVRQPGGPLQLEWDGEGEVFLSGPAVEVYEGDWPDLEAGS